jgi:hypothetical protein
MIEKDLARIADALDCIVELMSKSATPKQAKPKADPDAGQHQYDHARNQDPADTAPAPAPATPAPAPAPAPVPTPAATVAPFTDAAGLRDYTMKKYKELGAVKGALIQGCLMELGYTNMTDIQPASYGDFFKKVEAL